MEENQRMDRLHEFEVTKKHDKNIIADISGKLRVRKDKFTCTKEELDRLIAGMTGLDKVGGAYYKETGDDLIVIITSETYKLEKAATSR